MRLTPESGIFVLRDAAHWQRCALHDTVYLDGAICLQSQTAPVPESNGNNNFDAGFAGMAFDVHCRLFHPLPETARLEYVLWGQTNALGVHDTSAHPYPITGPETEVDGQLVSALPKRPQALACGAEDFLYIADPDTQTVWLLDIWQQEVAKQLAFTSPPIDLSSCGEQVYVLLADGTTWLLSHCDTPKRTHWPAVSQASRLSVPTADKAWVLQRAGQTQASLYALHLSKSIATPFVTDIQAERHPDCDALLTLAQRPGEPFLRMQINSNQATPAHALLAPHYDGRGIALAPDGRMVYWTTQGLRHTQPARQHYRSDGRVFGYALDAEREQSSWGRLQLEACIPPGTHIRFWAFTSDELDFNDPIDGKGGDTPLLSQNLWDHYAGTARALYRDSSPRPLTAAPAEGFAYYDAPLAVANGRYLWLVFELIGTRSKSPRLRCATVEYPGHNLLSKLPRTLWRDPAAQDFLLRYLMPIAAMLDEWQDVSSTRHRLLDARITPDSALPWLASFVGLVLDPCWPLNVQRNMIEQAASLFRTRGTVQSLRRMLETLTQADVILIEHFRLRGGGVVGNATVNHSQAVLGVGYRIGGRIGELNEQKLPDQPEVDFDDFAHRFTVTIVASLSEAQLSCVRRLIEQHKPAHTDFTLCTADSGIRAGVGSHIGISSVVGKSAGFSQALMGDAVLGAGYVMGRPDLTQSTSREGQEQ